MPSVTVDTLQASLLKLAIWHCTGLVSDTEMSHLRDVLISSFLGLPTAPSDDLHSALVACDVNLSAVFTRDPLVTQQQQYLGLARTPSWGSFISLDSASAQRSSSSLGASGSCSLSPNGRIGGVVPMAKKELEMKLSGIPMLPSGDQSPPSEGSSCCSQPSSQRSTALQLVNLPRRLSHGDLESLVGELPGYRSLQMTYCREGLFSGKAVVEFAEREQAESAKAELQVACRDTFSCAEIEVDFARNAGRRRSRSS